MQIYPALVPSERVSIRHRLLIHIERRRRVETSNYSETGKRELFYKCNQIAKTLVFMYRFFSASRICSMILTRKVQRSRMHICFSERTRWNMSGVYANKLREIGLFRWESNWQKGRRRVMQCILLTTMYIRYLYLAFITDSSIFKLYGVFLFFPPSCVFMIYRSKSQRRTTPQRDSTSISGTTYRIQKWQGCRCTCGSAGNTWVCTICRWDSW